MRILAVESSCDDTSVAVIQGDVRAHPLSFVVYAHKTASQKIHENYGGVFPAKAKEQHVAHIVPLLHASLQSVPVDNFRKSAYSVAIDHQKIDALLSHESALIDDFKSFVTTYPAPPVDAIAVTYGPGLEPCLWVGVNIAKALSMIWNIPLIPVNHMEGHTLSAMMQPLKTKSAQYTLQPITFPALALLISGGHTQLVHMPKPLQYTVIGKTLDDAVGEAYDKVARMLSLPYPGGPHLAKLADEYRDAFKNRDSLLKNLFPRPILTSKDFNFSFSGLKTAVLYHLRDTGHTVTSHSDKQRVAYAFESAVSEVLAEKTRRAIQHYDVQTLLLGGGVACNRHLRRKFTHVANDEHVTLLLPEFEVTTDNALMIAIAAFYRLSLLPIKQLAVDPESLTANGSLSF